MIAFNFYEPLAALLDRPGSTGASPTRSACSLFCIALVILRLTTETLAPAMVRFPMPALPRRPARLRPGRRARHHGDPPPGLSTRPGAQEGLRRLRLQVSKPPFGLGPRPPVAGLLPARDRRRSSPSTMRTAGPIQEPTAREAELNFFDPRGEWLINHQNARPYGPRPCLGNDEAASTAGGGR